MNLVIKNYTELSETSLSVAGKVLVDNDGQSPVKYFKNIYKTLDINYPKFYKMDRLCKVGFLAVEALLTNQDSVHQIAGENKALVIQNYSSSIDTDLKHQESIKDRNNYYPSPAVFVYTLPNIMLGEICIRNGIKGENSCFLSASKDLAFLEQYVRTLFEQENYKCCITGWVDYTENHYIANLFLVEQATPGDAFISKFEKQFLELMIKNHGKFD